MSKEHKSPSRQRRARITRLIARLKPAVLRRDKYRCVDCGGSYLLTIDHIIPASEGGPTTKANLITRCDACHKHRHGLDVKTFSEKRYARFVAFKNRVRKKFYPWQVAMDDGWPDPEVARQAGEYR